MRAPIEVCAAVIRRGGRFLLATRPAESHLAGKWEFPGGKRHHGETAEACIARELGEELGLDVSQATFLAVTTHRYPTKTIRLTFLECVLADKREPVAHDGQQVGWFTFEELHELDLAPADREFLPVLTSLQGAASQPRGC